MIMAGRGRPVVNESIKIGAASPLATEFSPETQILMKDIDKINVTSTSKLDDNSKNAITNVFMRLLESEDKMEIVLVELYTKALNNAEFGQKMAISIRGIFNMNPFRKILLNLMQKEFELKDAISQVDKPRYYNSIKFLCHVLHYIKVSDTPIVILVGALINYFSLLLDGAEEELKFMTMQVAYNLNEILYFSDKHDELQCKLRKALINKTLTNTSKCWILLIIDILYGKAKLQQGPLKDFYIENLAEGFNAVESNLCASDNSDAHKDHPENLNNEKKVDKKRSESELCHQITGLNVSKSDSGQGKDLRKKKPSYHTKNTKSDNLNWRNTDKTISEHDDRFDREENYYENQSPRTKKFDGQKKNIHEGKKFHVNSVELVQKSGFNKTSPEILKNSEEK